MQIEAHLDSETVARLEDQSGLLLRTYRADLAEDPTSLATESSRSNMIAFRHSIEQVYGNATALDMANVLPALPMSRLPVEEAVDQL
jgi:hypothetical protein